MSYFHRCYIPGGYDFFTIVAEQFEKVRDAYPTGLPGFPLMARELYVIPAWIAGIQKPGMREKVLPGSNYHRLNLNRRWKFVTLLLVVKIRV
ncbi:hypothetical protein TI04_10625 [Achromatium sp. WMS2]|nr:hypothetical protein TI04_10625 [Achromatium sp. WMS2]